MAKRKERRSQAAPPARAARLTDRERGMKAFRHNDYDGAVAAWTAAYHAAPSEALAQALAEAHFRRACLTWRRNLERALDDLRAANRLVPDDALYLYHLGLMHHRLGDLLSATESYRASLRLDPYSYARAAYMICLAIAESGGDPPKDEAWELLTPALRDRLLPGDDAFREAIGHLASGNFEDAEMPLRQLSSRFLGFAHYYLGVIAWRRGEKDEALARWLAARAAGFNTPALRNNLVAAYIEQAGKQADSPDLMDTAQAALKLAPESPVLLRLKQRAEFLAGNRAAEAGRWRSALTHWQAARQSGAGQVNQVPRELLANLALALEQLERWEEAANAWREVVRRRPRRGENAWSPVQIAQLWRHIDTLYARAGHFTESVATLRYAIKAQPDDLTLRLALIRRHMENQNWRGAQDAARRVLEMAPDQPEARALYAQSLDMGGDLDLMIEAWEQVRSTDDDRYSRLAAQRLIALYTERADFFLSVDDTEAAAEDYARALSHSPDDSLLRARYGALLALAAPEHARSQFEAVDLADPAAAFTVISAWHRAGDHEEAARWLERATAARAPGASLFVELGVDAFQYDAEVANRYFARALESVADGDGPGLFTTIAVALADYDDLPQAYAYARRALKLDSQFGPAHFHLGLWDAAQGRRQAAREHLLKAWEWAERARYTDIAEGIEEAINLLEERYVPTADEILETIDPEGANPAMRRLMGRLPMRGGQRIAV